MNDVVIVSAVRSPVGKGKKDGALASVHAVDLSAHMIRAAIDKVGVDPLTIDDVYWGCAMPEATQGLNVARLAWLRAGMPVEVPAAMDDDKITVIDRLDSARRDRLALFQSAWWTAVRTLEAVGSS